MNKSDIQILFADQEIVVCVKPVNLDSETELPNALSAQLGGAFFPVHRLDKNVGGVMVFARTKAAAAELSRLIGERAFVKEYVAVCHGVPPEAGEWEDLLFKDSAKNKVFVVKRMRNGVKTARLSYARVDTDGARSLVRVVLDTGRSHQIRVQFASRGFPLAGDHKYGAKDDASAPLLFSCRISFPWRGKTLCFERMPEGFYP